MHLRVLRLRSCALFNSMVQFDEIPSLSSLHHTLFQFRCRCCDPAASWGTASRGCRGCGSRTPCGTWHTLGTEGASRVPSWFIVRGRLRGSRRHAKMRRRHGMCLLVLHGAPVLRSPIWCCNFSGSFNMIRN